jgi:hypothetical protein
MNTELLEILNAQMKKGAIKPAKLMPQAMRMAYIKAMYALMVLFPIRLTKA